MIWNLYFTDLSQSFVTFCNRLKTELFAKVYGELSLAYKYVCIEEAHITSFIVLFYLVIINAM